MPDRNFNPRSFRDVAFNHAALIRTTLLPMLAATDTDTPSDLSHYLAATQSLVDCADILEREATLVS